MNPTIAELVALVRRAPARCGRTRVVLIDGPAGAGKTTLANRLAVGLGGRASGGAGSYDPSRPTPADHPVQVLHGDDMYEGWSGLEALEEVLVEGVLVPLAEGRAGEFHMWDWVASSRTHAIAVPQRDFLVVEGVGVGRRSARAHASALLYVDAPWPVRLERGLARDGEAMRDEWERWHIREDLDLSREGTQAAAHAVIDGTAPAPD